MLPALEAMMGFSDTLPIDALNALFAMIDPYGVGDKYRDFAAPGQSLGAGAAVRRHGGLAGRWRAAGRPGGARGAGRLVWRQQPGAGGNGASPACRSTRPGSRFPPFAPFRRATGWCRRPPRRNWRRVSAAGHASSSRGPDISAWSPAPMPNRRCGSHLRIGCAGYDAGKGITHREGKPPWTISSSSPPRVLLLVVSTVSSVPPRPMCSAPSALKAAIERAGLSPEEIDEAILGQVLTAAQGQNPARQAARAAGIPDSKTAFGINQVCGSGLRAVALAAQQIMQRRVRDRDRRRAGEHEPVHPCRLSARRHEDGRCRLHRHHDQGRAVGRLQRLPHGHHRRERGEGLADHPRRPGRAGPGLAAEGRRRAESREIQG